MVDVFPGGLVQKSIQKVTNEMAKGTFIISLDFELHWGVSDHRTIESYYENLKNTPEVVNRLLDIFDNKNIHATWATVGMLFCRSKNELTAFVPIDKKPSYTNPALSNYRVAENAGENESEDPFHYANTLIKKIIETPGQELATHTFSHYYCLEPGQDPDQFYADILAAIKVTEREGVRPVSIVFPRNQYGDSYINKCRQAGIKVYRGNFLSWVYKAEAKSRESIAKRIFRLADSYVPVSGYRLVAPTFANDMLNIPGSCFLRPYNKKLAWFEPLRLSRIKNEMTAAAKKGMSYHLWWHPHNFGKNMPENFQMLNAILEHFDKLSGKYGMESKNMKEVYESHQ
jgi:peptidoglycan/xylan/chitin deacetylase (PgdA/CDA1 family)